MEVEIKREFYPNGVLYREIPYVNGVREGVSRIYYENGQLKFEIPYKNGEKHGVEKFYVPTNKMVVWHFVTYKNGKRHGCEKHFFLNGTVSQICFWNNNKRVGVLEQYSEKSGKKWCSIYYENDKRTKDETYDKNGNLTMERFYDKYGYEVRCKTYQNNKLLYDYPTNAVS